MIWRGCHMENVKVNKLAEVLKRLNSGEDSEKVKADAKELIDELGLVELSLAEQSLVDEGLQPEELQELCKVHLDAFSEGFDGVSDLEKGHPIDTLTAEHKEIIKFLDILEEANKRIQENKDDIEAVEIIRHVAEHLVAAEKHHQREEDVLFPELEKRGLTGPPRIMRLEHDEIRPKKKAFKELVDTDGFFRSEENLKELNKLVKELLILIEHIYKEDNILYPSALEAIEDEKVWVDVKRKCDEIGYCCFSPEN